MSVRRGVHPADLRPWASETEFHLAVANLLRLGIAPGGGFFFHVPNQGKRSRATGGLLKGMGMLTGVSDLVLVPRIPRPAGFLELKHGDGSLRKGQREFRDMCAAQGFPWAEARDLDEVARFAARVYGEDWRIREPTPPSPGVIRAAI